ncbi:hypothetical protein RYX36_012882 [Vicia faba]
MVTVTGQKLLKKFYLSQCIVTLKVVEKIRHNNILSSFSSLLNNHCLNCTLWEGYTMQFNEYNNGRKDSSIPTIMVLQFAKVKEIPQLILEEYSSQTLTSQTHSSTQAFGSSHITPYDKLMYKAIVLPLAEIVKFQAAVITDPLKFPLALDALVGVTMIFKVKRQPD